MVSVLSGGKAVNSAVKFSKVFLIIDAAVLANKGQDPIGIIPFYQKFLVALKKSFAATKGGEASFKVLPDNSYFNAN